MRPGTWVLITRDSAKDIGMRDLYLRLDDEPERTLKFGGKTEFTPTPGRHRLVATNRLLKKVVEFELGPNEELRFEAANISMGCLSATALATGFGLYGVDLVRLETLEAAPINSPE